jgi:hypothetical protein
MDASVFRTRVAPLLGPDGLRALRCVGRHWLWLVDQLADVKGAFGLRRHWRLRIADVRYGHAVHSRVDGTDALLACADGEVADLQWAVATFESHVQCSPQLGLRLLKRVARAECMTFVIRQFRVSPVEALQECCEAGRLDVAQWLTSAFGLTATDARSGNNFALRFSCENGHLAVAQWLVSTFGLTLADARALNDSAFFMSCANGHLAVAQWLASTFGVLATADDGARSACSRAFLFSCKNGHLAVAQWLAGLRMMSGLAAGDGMLALTTLCHTCANGQLTVAEWLATTFALTMDDLRKFMVRSKWQAAFPLPLSFLR